MLQCTVNGANESLEHIHASELYPKPDTTLDDRPLPFPPLEGEGVSYLDDTSEGVIVLTNYRLFIRYKNSFINLVLGLIESVECRDIFFIHLYCKDARTVRYDSVLFTFVDLLLFSAFSDIRVASRIKSYRKSHIKHNKSFFRGKIHLDKNLVKNH